MVTVTYSGYAGMMNALSYAKDPRSYGQDEHGKWFIIHGPGYVA